MEYLHAKDELSRKSLKEINSLVKKHKVDINLPIYDILWMLVLKQSANMPGRQIKNPFGDVAQLSDACMNIIEDITKELGSGAFGFPIYQVCIKGKDDCKYAAKFLPYDHDDQNTLEMWQKEVQMAELASELDIGPKFITSWTCEIPQFGNKVLVLITKMLDITLYEYMQRNNIDISNAKLHLYKLFNKMLDDHFFHGDLHPDNIMLNLNAQGNVTDALAIDFNNTKIDPQMNIDTMEHTFSSVYQAYRNKFPELGNGTWRV